MELSEGRCLAKFGWIEGLVGKLGARCVGIKGTWVGCLGGVLVVEILSCLTYLLRYDTFYVKFIPTPQIPRQQ